MKISEMITDRYKLRIPPTVYYDLLADVREVEEEQEPTTKNDLGVDYTINGLDDFIEFGKKAFGVELTIKALEQEPVLDKIKGQIKDYLRGVEITLEVLVENDPLRPKMEGAKDTLEECLELIDKAEKEQEQCITTKL